MVWFGCENQRHVFKFPSTLGEPTGPLVNQRLQNLFKILVKTKNHRLFLTLRTLIDPPPSRSLCIPAWISDPNRSDGRTPRRPSLRGIARNRGTPSGRHDSSSRSALPKTDSKNSARPCPGYDASRGARAVCCRRFGPGRRQPGPHRPGTHAAQAWRGRTDVPPKPRPDAALNAPVPCACAPRRRTTTATCTLSPTGCHATTTWTGPAGTTSPTVAPTQRCALRARPSHNAPSRSQTTEPGSASQLRNRATLPRWLPQFRLHYPNSHSPQPPDRRRTSATRECAVRGFPCPL